ncbi:MAG: hypothetical protein MUE69_04690 [Myxococcota bacterium]|jgi:hypothetical protein|nr:hypothetical protein [Myxococcota bacterium]
MDSNIRWFLGLVSRSVLVTTFSLAGCGDDDVSPPTDAGFVADAGLVVDAEVPRDTGIVIDDAGRADADTGRADAGPPSASCDGLPTELPQGPTDDVYFNAVRVCGVPARCTLAPTVGFETPECEDAPTVDVGNDITDAAQVRLRTAGWTIVDPSAGTVFESTLRSAPLDTEVVVTLVSPEGDEHELAFRVDFESVQITRYDAR